MLTNQYVSDCRTRIVNLMQIALHSAYRQDCASTPAGSAIEDNPNPAGCPVRYEKIDIVRNQLCFGPHHCQTAFISLRKLHDIAQLNALVSHSHSRMQGGEAKPPIFTKQLNTNPAT